MEQETAGRHKTQFTDQEAFKAWGLLAAHVLNIVDTLPRTLRSWPEPVNPT
jgi:hypothetical protein